MSSWSWLLNGRLWGAAGLVALLALSHCTAYRQGGASAGVDLADLRTSHAEQARLAAQAREREHQSAREREAALQSQIDQEARNGQTRIDAAVAAADRARAAEHGVRGEFAAFRAAVRSAAAAAGAAGAGTPAADAARVRAQLLDELGERTERIAGLAGLYARAADNAYAAGITCELSAAVLRAAGDKPSAPP